MLRPFVPALLLLGSLPSASPGQAAEPGKAVTVEDLLGRMVDLRWLTTPPAEGERTVQFSSYDRASKIKNGELVNRFANGDRGHYLRVEKGADGAEEFVLADAEGPGYVSRIWSANPDGELRIYIDGAEKPVLAADFPKLTNGEIEPFTAPFGHDASRGRNLYFPFPFAKRIKIVTTKGDQYFQVAVTYLPKGTAVESYSAEILKRAGAKIGEVRTALMDPDHGRPKSVGTERYTLEPGATRTQEVGPPRPGGALTWLRLKPAGENLETTLARSLLTIRFDGAETPQVSAPLGDFFGSGPGINPYATTATSVAKDGTMTSRWIMPFEKTAQIVIHNGGDSALTLDTELAGEDLPWFDGTLQFHARWMSRDQIQTVAGNGTEEWPALRVKGAPGRFVGLLLNVFNPTPAWWGEGDEKVFVDGEAFPSTFGTGTEDYFGYAWCDPHPYQNPFHAQTRCDGPGNRGNTSNVRYQILDQIPWSESIAFDMEVWHWKAVKVDYGSIAYFYAAPGAKIEPGPVADLSGREVKASTFALHREPGAIEGESLKVLSATGGPVPNQDMTGFGEEWSNGSHLWWTCRQPGGVLRLELPVEKAGTYDLSAAFTKAIDYGTATITLDGKPLGSPVDLFHDGVIHTGAVPLGRATLEAGPHSLVISMERKNPRSTSYLFGMDWIKLAPAAGGTP